MPPVRALARPLAACLLAVAPLQGLAAPFLVQLGDARIALDAPPGFSDTIGMGSPRLLELAESLTPASNRILLFALSDADVRRFTVGDQLEAKRYMIAVTPKGLEYQRITTPAFNAFVLESMKGIGAPPAAATDTRKLLDTAPGRLMLLADLRREPGVVSVLQGVRHPAQGRAADKGQYGLSTTTLILLRGKALNLSVFGSYEDEADLEWIRTVTARWTEELQRLNNR